MLLTPQHVVMSKMAIIGGRVGAGSPACFLAEDTFQRSGNVSDLGHLQASVLPKFVFPTK